LEAGLVKATRTTYAAGIQRYVRFCKAAKLSTTPATESTLILFGIHLTTAGTSHVSIKVYLSAVRHFLKSLHESFSQQLTPWLQIILKGIKKHQALTYPPSQLPSKFLTHSLIQESFLLRI